MTTLNLEGTTPAHRALFVPELLDIIFNLLDRKTNVTNTRVCKRWSEVAVEIVWQEVDDLLHLLRLLKPIREHEDTFEYSFETLPEADDWSRFEKYAIRVRSLKFRSTMYDLDIHPLLDGIARTRTSSEIFPNMHTLEWIYASTAYMKPCKLFLHRRLRNLSVTAPYRLDPCPDFYTDLCALAPQLRSLTLFVQFPGEPIDAQLPSLLQNLPELKKIVLPEFHYTTTVIEHLSRAKSIAIIDVSSDLKLGYGSSGNVVVFDPVLGEGAFPCLRELSLSARIEDMDNFFRSSFAPVRITALYINSYAFQTPTEVHDFLTTLSQQCRFLSRLNLGLYNKFLFILARNDHQLSYDTIKPILAFPNLISFELVHKYPVKITLDDLEDLTSHWPHLECLMLNVEPLFIHEEYCTLDVRALLPFAEHCPRLHTLGLYIKAARTEIPSPHTPLKPFNALRTLSFGTSQIRHPGAIALFLGRICPPRCRLDLGITWTEVGDEDDRPLPANLLRVLRKRCSTWRAVEKLLPAFTRFRTEDGDWPCVFQEEPEGSRVRNRLLIDNKGARRSSCIIV